VATAEALHKPDMPAVIARTHITSDLHGLLLPIFEAISNAVHGIEQRFPEHCASAGRVSISFKNPLTPEKLLISVCDNGAGLGDENYLSFLTPFSGQKLSKKGRGFGRFIAFKVFDRILYSSRYTKDVGGGTRTFRFNIYDDREIIHFDGSPDFEGSGVCVEFDELKPEWHPLIAELSGVTVADEIAHHFFPEFLRGSLPKV
jgi:hypothetical protein